jgi:hypothetical protein
LRKGSNKIVPKFGGCGLSSFVVGVKSRVAFYTPDRNFQSIDCK